MDGVTVSGGMIALAATRRDAEHRGVSTTAVPSALDAAQIRNLDEANPLREPVLRSIIDALRLPPGGHGLDVGCGIGHQASLLVEATRPSGRVTGLDISPALLACAEARAASSGYADRVAFREGDMKRLPFPDDTFDWAWSADCVGYPCGELLPSLREMARVVRPGGSIAILGWTSQRVLPGYAMLEARLEATCSAYAPLLQGASPESHFARALRFFAQAGITDAAARTFVADVRAPMGAELRTAMTSLFEMLWGDASGASESDKLDLARLRRPESPDFILDLPEYHGFFTYSVFSGVVPK